MQLLSATLSRDGTTDAAAAASAGWTWGRTVMGEFANNWPARLVGGSIAGLLIALNVMLLVRTLGGGGA